MTLDAEKVKERAKECIGKRPQEIDCEVLFKGWDVEFVSGACEDIFIGGTVQLWFDKNTSRITHFAVMGTGNTSVSTKHSCTHSGCEKSFYNKKNLKFHLMRHNSSA